LLALIPAVLLTLVLMARLSGTSDPETLQKLGQAVIGLLFVALSAIAIATGISFSGFRYRPQFQQAEGYSMPPFFAALPVATGDLVWTKIQAVAQRMLWISAGVALMCAVIARISGFQLAALPLVSSVLLALSAAVSALWITLLGRAKVMWISFLLICFLPVFVLAGLQRTDEFVASLPVILPIAAAVKLGALALLMFHVGSRKMLDWGRLAIITAFWAATAATVMACLTFYAAMSLLNALFAGIVVAPVLGAVGAPAALAWNRAR
jgi:hypothetical protein